jgi:two-component system CheB/CheR fusion protein
VPAPDPEERPDLVRSALNFPVIGIGASAGGMAALLRFFENMPAKTGMAYVVILHLSPRHESNASSILQRATQMPVIQIVEATPIKPDHIYVIPPTHDLLMDDGQLCLVDPVRVKGPHVAIDLFFRALAHAQRERAICIVMSGTGADGAVGLTRIKEHGGITFVQSPDDAEHDDMPTAAIATGMVDFVMPAVEMPQKLMDLWDNARRISLPDETLPETKADATENLVTAELAENALSEIMALLLKYSGNDFKHYKRATVLRRIERRLQVNGLPDLPTYRDYLQEHSEETRPLLQDMLISVTNFFRDRDAFEALEREVLPILLENRSPDDAIRVWVAGCATGEEAYSISMLLSERADGKLSAPEIQVFATDIDENAISVGRAAIYPKAIATDVSPVRLRQFFTQEKDQFRVAKSLREKVLFARHNLLRDPPFSRLDLISCRNLLIYLDREAQTRILEMFRFALKPGGFLFLGQSESADPTANLFMVVDKKNRIYRANPLVHASRHLPLAFSGPGPVRPSLQKASNQPSPQLQPPSLAELHRRCIEQYAPPSVLIDEKHDALHLSEDVGQFLEHSGGTPTRNLLANVQPELRIALRTALYQAASTGHPASSRPVPVERGEQRRLVRVSVKPFLEPVAKQTLYLVVFDEVKDPPLLELASGELSRDSVIRQLELENKQLKEHLQTTIEQSESSTEELKASNEELQATNEELRSATEELETSKEELQSMNEELITVNFELKVKVEETGKINDDLQNFIAASDIATVFIDNAMRIKRYTPQAVNVFNLIPSDINRPLLDITDRLNYESLARDAEQAFKTLQTIERSIQSTDGKHYLARIRPYRTTEDRIEGAVLTFVDVTALRQAEETLRASEERLRITAETTRDYAILTIDDNGLVTTWNGGAERVFGYSEQEILGQPLALTFTPEDRAAGVPEAEMQSALTDGRAEDDRWHVRKDGRRFFCSAILTPLQGKVRGFSKIARDMTGSKQQEALREALLIREKAISSQAHAANELKDKFLAVMSHELKHPLNLIQVNTELLVNQPEVRAVPAVARTGETIRLAIASQAKIIDDLLDLSRMRTGKLTLEMSVVPLTELLRTIVGAASEDVRRKKLDLVFEHDDGPILARCDRVRTEQIFWNLINNAIKFTPEGGKISVRLAREPAFARLTVMDSGKGIAPGFLSQVFGMFSQEPPSQQAQNVGLGVGLALVQELAVAQGGRVQAESQGLGRGATFSVWLPLETDEASAEQGPGPAMPHSLKGLRVLAVDDMPDALEPFAALLRIEGAVVDTADSGRKALQLLASSTYDLLISDLSMSDMDGFDLIQAIRKRPDLKGLSAIALSGYGRQADVRRALELGFNGHLAKPATLAQVRQAVDRLVPPPGT